MALIWITEEPANRNSIIHNSSLKTLFLTLKTFSATGAIEKVCRVAGRALYENSLTHRGDFRMYSLEDPKNVNTQPYLPANVFRGFGKSRLQFIRESIQEAKKSAVVVLSHYSLLTEGYLIKLLAPQVKLVLIAHGIEIWKPISTAKKNMMRKVDQVVAASNFTKIKMASLNGIPDEKFSVLYNCLDPFLLQPPGWSRRKEFRNSYGFEDDDVVLMAFSRITAAKNDTGYDKVLITIKKLQSTCAKLRLLCVGKYDEEEKGRLDRLIYALGIEFDVIFTGFIPETVIGDYFNMADAYIIPGEKEVFGFPFLEALFYNKPVIAGKIDEDTTEGFEEKMGHFINIDNQEEIIDAVRKTYECINTFKPDRRLLVNKFSFPAYKDNWKVLFDKLVAS
jgi:phosphatidyl-myo-inositol dimannoside synthase